MNAADRRGVCFATVSRSRPLVVFLLAFLSALAAGCGAAPKARGPSEGVYSFWPPLPNEPRVQFVTAYRYSTDVEPERSTLDELVFGTERQVLPIAKPYGVAMWEDRIYVCDITNPGVVILDLGRQETRLMGTGGVQPMRQPTDIAIADDGTKYVVDRRLGRVFVFNADDQQVNVFGGEGFTPVAAAVHGRELFVAEFETQSVWVMDRFSGQQLRTIGRGGGGDGEFVRPLGVDVDDEGNVYVSDVIRGRLQKFDPSGQLLFARGQLADAPGNFVRPKHLVVDRDGIIYVVDAAFQNVQMFDREGELLMFFGSAGTHLGSMDLPAGVAVYEGDMSFFEPFIHPAFRADRLILVTNQFGMNKVSVYALGGLKEGRTVADIAPYAMAVDTGQQTDEEAARDLLQQPGGAAATQEPPQP